MSRIKFTGLTLRNFRSIRDLTWQLDALESGLTFVSGQNRVEPSLGANGAGKSSIFEGLVWTLYGQNSRNIKTPTLVTWGQSKRNIYGLVSLIKDDEEIQIERTANTAGLRVNDVNGWRNVQQSDVNNLLGLDFNSFIWLVYIPQFGIRFFDLTPTEKLTLFTSIMEEALEKWVVFAEKAKARASELTRLIADTSKEHSQMTGLLQAQSTKEYRKLSREFEAKRQEDISEVNKLTIKIARKIRDVDSSYQENERCKSRNEDEIAELTETIGNLELELRERVDTLNNAVSNRTETRVTLRMLEKDLRELEEVEGVCPLCQQVVNDEHKTRTINDLRERIAEEIENDKRLDDLVDTAQRSQRSKLVQIEKKRENLDELNNVTRDLQTTRRRLDEERDRLTNQLVEYKNDIKALKSQRNEYDTLIQKTKNKKRVINRVVTSLAEELAEMNRELVAQNYWKKGFKDIRIMLIKQAIKEFEAYVNANLVNLGLENWQVTLDVESETKSGSVVRELSVFITTQEDGEKMTVPFNVWSGGEGQRLRLAGILGLIDFIQNYNNVEFDLEVYDEPTTWLSNTGIANLIDTLKERSDELQRRILIIDHRDLASMGTFDNMLTVYKDADGTHIE